MWASKKSFTDRHTPTARRMLLQSDDDRGRVVRAPPQPSGFDEAVRGCAQRIGTGVGIRMVSGMGMAGCARAAMRVVLR